MPELWNLDRIYRLARDEKVGNFPVRMLVILVKLCKLIEYKKQLIANLTLMNDAAEKMNMFGNKYDVEFKVTTRIHCHTVL